MAGDQHDSVFLPLCEQLEESPARLGVEVGGRFIEDQHIGIPAQRGGDQQFLLLSAGQAHERLMAKSRGVEAESRCNLGDVVAVRAAQ